MAHDNGGQGWAPATYLEPIVPSGSNDEGYDWISVTDSNGIGEDVNTKYFCALFLRVAHTYCC